MNAALFIFDIIWIFTMGSVWSNKPVENDALWFELDFVHDLVFWLSIVNIILRAVIEILLFVAIGKHGGLKGIYILNCIEYLGPK